MDTDWTEINLPFHSTGNWLWETLEERGIHGPNLEEEERAIFGASEDDLWEMHQEGISQCNSYRDSDLYDEITSERPDIEIDSSEWDDELERRFQAHLEANPDLKEAWEAQLLRRKIREWGKTHPKQLEYDALYDGVLQEDRQRSFAGRGLAKPGVMIELANGERHLLGSVNCLGGVCDDCTAFESTDIVVRYKVLVDWPTVREG